ncbi:hypothetical protein PI125_g17277 [Phytophthora idaei]|nr:hypothetical protein PI125_g17277 [Phytophthora idaei]
MPRKNRKQQLLVGLRAVWGNRSALSVDDEDSSGEDDDISFSSLSVYLYAIFLAVCRLIADHHEFESVIGKQQTLNVEFGIISCKKRCCTGLA